MREVTLLIRHHDTPESDVSANYPDVTLRSRSSMTGRTSNRKRIIEVSGDPEVIPEFLDEFGDASPVLDLEPLSPVGRSRTYVAMTYDAYQWDSISERLSDMEVYYRNGTTITAGWERWTLYLEDHESIGDIRASLEAAGNETELVRAVELSELDAPAQLDMFDFVQELTPRQREVLTLAISEGYYQRNRGTSVEDLADKVGVASTTAWEHLKRAEEKVMDELYDYLRSAPE
ncbi:helix-turn-helix domain-containing protein [Haloferax chudinovii]|uniref:Helix-turn-helix domain-containing protein n=1 Tax=Haloferax chudinovii TaxID=1109010 RepID=A0ABD5XHG1_9EURY